MVDVRQNLIIGVRMNGRHDAVLDANHVMQRLNQRRQAVGRAGSIRNNSVILGQRVVVDAIYDGAINVRATRCRNNDFLGARFDVLARRLTSAEKSGALEYNFYAQFAPRQFCRIALGEDLNSITVYNYVIAIHLDSAGKVSMRCIAARQMRIAFASPRSLIATIIEFVCTSRLHELRAVYCARCDRNR